MKNPWLPVIAAIIVAVPLIWLAKSNLGILSSIIILIVLASAYLGIHLFNKHQIRRLCELAESLNEEERNEMLSELDLDIRKEVTSAITASQSKSPKN
ncbi:MAG: hypothetical protein LBV12_06005 [Puniceicoccales bacterium]|jgi:uncharacterized protein YpuA (DUF1002 family)|nr:hypothetical protein [Puniceicoccales bacterium]